MKFSTRSYIVQGDQLGYSSGSFNEVFLVILIKHLSFEKHFLFSQCGCLSGPNYLNLHWKLHFSENLQDAKFKHILSLRPNHCCPSRDTKTSKFFSHSFSRYNYEKLIQTLPMRRSGNNWIWKSRKQKELFGWNKKLIFQFFKSFLLVKY